MSDEMLNEVVNRLREAAQVDEYYAVTMHRPLLIAIADEIERLRKLVHRWETCELVAESLCDMNNPESFCDTCKESF